MAFVLTTNGTVAVQPPAEVTLGTGVVISGATLSAAVTGVVNGQVVSWQFTDDGADILGASGVAVWPYPIEYQATIGTDGIADGSQLGVTITVDEGDPLSSGTRQIRYPVGNASASALSDWTIDETLDLDFTGDFTVPNLTGSYTITGLPAGVVDDGDGTISGAPTGSPGPVSFTVTFGPDQYGDTYQANYSVDIVSQSLAPVFTEDPAVSLDGRILTVTTGTATESPDYSITMALDGVPVTPSGSGPWTFATPGDPLAQTISWSVSATANGQTVSVSDSIVVPGVTVGAGSITLISDNISYTPGGGGVGPILTVSQALFENTIAPYEVFIATHLADVTFDAAEIIAGTDVSILDALTLQDDNGTVTDQELTLTQSFTNGYLSLVVRDSSDPKIVSNVPRLTGVDVDATAAALSSPVATQTGATTADWSITSNEAAGVVYAGVRPTASAALTSAQLIAGSGGAGVAWSTDTTMTADANNGGTFTGLTAETAYKVDYVAVDAWGNVGSVVSSAEFTTAAAPVLNFSYIGTATDLDAQASYTFTDADITGLDFTAGGKFLVQVAHTKARNSGLAGLAEATGVTIGGVAGNGGSA
jgi:hypothetical protein